MKHWWNESKVMESKSIRMRKGSGKWQTPLISGKQQCTTHVVRVN